MTKEKNKQEKTLRISKTEMRQLSKKDTGIYFGEVMKKLFRDEWESHLTQLLAGDRRTLDLCASRLRDHLDFFPLLHTLCLITGRKDDLEEEDPLKAADRWLTWFGEKGEGLAWDMGKGRWTLPE